MAVQNPQARLSEASNHLPEVASLPLEKTGALIWGGRRE